MNPEPHAPLPDSDVDTPAADSSMPRRAGRARERHLKRLQQRQGQPSVPSAAVPPKARTPTTPRSMRPAVARQLKPAGGLKLPAIRLQQGQVVALVIGAVVLLFGGVWFLGQLRDREPDVYPNAVWVGQDWTYARHSEEDMARFVLRLRAARIGTVYAWVSWLAPDGTWAGDPLRRNQFDAVRGDVEAFVLQFRRLYPDARLLGWIGLPSGSAAVNYGLDQAQFSQRITAFSQTVVSQLGFDGVFLHVEPVSNGDENYLSILRQVRAASSDSAALVVAVPPDWTPTDTTLTLPPLYAPGTFWEAAYKQRVALISDEMVVMAYNSGLRDPQAYSDWVAYQVQAFTSAVSALDGGARILISVPTHDAQLPGHDPLAENITSAVSGVRVGIAAAGTSGQFIQGLALFATWTLTDDEWQAFTDQRVR